MPLKSLFRAALAAMTGLAMWAAPVQAAETVKVALLLTYSGPSGATGQISENVIKLFQKKYGTTAGGRTIEFVKRDSTGPNPQLVRQITQELLVREKVQIMIGPDFTPNVLAVAPLLTEAKVPTFITGATTTGIIGERSPYLLRTFYTNTQAARPIAQWAYKNGVRKPFVAVADFASGHEIEALFTKSFREMGGTVAETLRLPMRNPEFSSYMQRIKDAQPDAVYVFLPAGDLGTQFLKAYAAAGLKDTNIKLLTDSGVVDEAVLDVVGDIALGTVSASVYSPAHESVLNRTLNAEYVAAYGKTPRLSVPAVAVWDAMRLIYDGLAAQAGQPWDPDKFMAFSKGRLFESPRGLLMLDKSNGDAVQSVYMRRVERKGGQLINNEFEIFRGVATK